MKKITVDGQRFVDADGREIILHGINFVCKEEKYGYIWPDAARMLTCFAGMGFNLIRLGIFWNAAEPTPGEYDDAYLERVKRLIRLAEDTDLYVMLDMHQDLFSCLYGDGAPEWATLTDGKPHPEGCTMWYDAYLQSDAIIAAADHFWRNDPASDGLGLIDHYSLLWQHIAETFKDCENIIGAEVMNEPFMGSIARQAFGQASAMVKEQFPGFDLSTKSGITAESQGIFSQIVGEALVSFDKDTLMPFYNRMNAAMREKWDVPFVTGGNIYCSAMFPSGITRLSLPDGSADSLQIYSPHAYDAVTDTGSLDGYNMDQMTYQLLDKSRTQEAIGAPVILGEWGAFPSAPFTGTLIRHTNEQIEKYLWSSTYWQYLPGFDTDDNFSALVRGYPMETEGELKGYHWDVEKYALEVYMEGNTTTCFVPGKVHHVDGAQWQLLKDVACGSVVEITCEGSGTHAVVIRSRKENM